MVKVDVKGCKGFVDEVLYNEYLQKALDAFNVLESEKGAGNDFLGWKHLPSETPESLIKDCEAVRDEWKALGVDLVVAIGIGGSYLKNVPVQYEKEILQDGEGGLGRDGLGHVRDAFEQFLA